MRGWMVSVSAAPRMASLACAQSTSLSAKMPGLVVDDEMVADRECFLQEHGLSSHPPVSADLPTMTAVYEGTVEPEWERNVVYVMHGGYRLAEGLPVVTVCPHTTWLLGIMRHMGLVMTYMAIDLDKKPAWFTRKFKAGSTPSVMYNGEVVEDSSVIFEWLPKTFPEEAKRVFVPEVGLDKPVAAMVMGALMGVMGDTTNDGGKQKEALDAWPTALAPLEGALEKHGMLGVGGKVSAADFRAAAFIYLAELIAPLLPGVLRNLDVLGKYPNISRWMGEGGMRGWMVTAMVMVEVP